MKINKVYILLGFSIVLFSCIKKPKVSSAILNGKANMNWSKMTENLTTKDSIQIFSDSLFYALENNYLHRKTTDWDKLKKQYIKKNLNSNSFIEAFNAYKDVFDSIGCDHCQIFYDKGYIKGTSKPLLFEDYSYGFGKKFSNGVEFSTSILLDKYGYIEIPGMYYPNSSKDSIDIKSQRMYDQIIELNKKNNLKGWILDLRFNTGGDAYLMLTALYHLLGDKTVYTELGVNKTVKKINKLKSGKFYSGSKIEREINPIIAPDLDTPIAIIIGNWTASAGEDVVIGFTDRENVLTIGESTYGYLTGNSLFKLPFNAQAALTTGYIANSHGEYLEHLNPEIYIKEKNSNYNNLLKDKNIIEAIKFFHSKK